MAVVYYNLLSTVCVCVCGERERERVVGVVGVCERGVRV